MERKYFEVRPLIVRNGYESTIRIRARFEHADFIRNKITEVRVIPCGGHTAHPWSEDVYKCVPFETTENLLVFSTVFEREDEYSVHLMTDASDGKKYMFAEFHLYALKEDLYDLNPYKGDFHMHSFMSDGRESPAYVAASARKVGFDFMALTDHRQYEPSLLAINAMKPYPTSMRFYPGEEVHPPENEVHIINFGSSFSVNAIFRENESSYRKQVAEYEKTIPDDITPKARYQVASCEWCFDKIREGGGIAMFCHPYWRPNDCYYIMDEVNETLMKRRKFDVLEVIGGFYRHQQESNALAVARWRQECSSGNVIPVAGVSDAHGCDRDLFGWYYTIIFAKDSEFGSLAESIRANRSLAVSVLPGEFPQIHGEFRLVKYAYFLLREFYPKHDCDCGLEGSLMLSALAGEEERIVEELNALKNRVPDCFEHLRK